jgi:hypothetical protein
MTGRAVALIDYGYGAGLRASYKPDNPAVGRMSSI